MGHGFFRLISLFAQNLNILNAKHCETMSLACNVFMLVNHLQMLESPSVLWPILIFRCILGVCWTWGWVAHSSLVWGNLIVWFINFPTKICYSIYPTPPHSTPLHSTPPHSTPPHSTPLHPTPPHPTPPHPTPLHSTLSPLLLLLTDSCLGVIGAIVAIPWTDKLKYAPFSALISCLGGITSSSTAGSSSALTGALLLVDAGIDYSRCCADLLTANLNPDLASCVSFTTTWGKYTVNFYNPLQLGLYFLFRRL